MCFPQSAGLHTVTPLSGAAASASSSCSSSKFSDSNSPGIHAGPASTIHIHAVLCAYIHWV